MQRPMHHQAIERQALRAESPASVTPGILSRTRVVNGLLACGIVAGVLYVAMDVIAALRYEGYSYKSQTISELSAFGAPTRSMWLVLGSVWAVLFIAFGTGVFASAGAKRQLRVAGGLLVLSGLLGLVAWPFAAMHQREVLAAGGGTMADTMHLVLSGVSSVITFTLIGIGIATFGKRFRIYSIATAAVVLVFGALMSADAPRVQDNESTPWVGVNERIMLFSAWLWYAVLAVRLMRPAGAGRLHDGAVSIDPGRPTVNV